MCLSSTMAEPLYGRFFLLRRFQREINENCIIVGLVKESYTENYNIFIYKHHIHRYSWFFGKLNIKLGAKNKIYSIPKCSCIKSKLLMMSFFKNILWLIRCWIQGGQANSPQRHTYIHATAKWGKSLFSNKMRINSN